MFFAELVGGADFAGAVEEFSVVFGFGSVLVEGFEIIVRDGGTDEDGSGGFGWMGGDIDHPVIAVGEVGVDVSGGAEHDLGAGGGAAVGVRAWVAGAGIGFDFNNLA